MTGAIDPPQSRRVVRLIAVEPGGRRLLLLAGILVNIAIVAYLAHLLRRQLRRSQTFRPKTPGER
jgi:hypothetical protein